MTEWLSKVMILRVRNHRISGLVQEEDTILNAINL